MAWIESHDDLATHPKTRRAARALGVSIPAMMGHLHLLWHWCLRHAETGDLSDYDLEDVADAMMWEGDAAELVEALIKCGPGNKPGFLERDDNGFLSVHDWMDYAGLLIQSRQEMAEAGARGNHERWHVQRGKHDPNCVYCQHDASVNQKVIGRLSGGESGGDQTPIRVLSHRNTTTTVPNQNSSSSMSTQSTLLPEEVAGLTGEQFWEQSTGLINKTQSDDMESYRMKGVEESVIVWALLDARRKGKSFKYACGTLNNLVVDNCLTLHQVAARENAFSDSRVRNRASPKRESAAERSRRLREAGSIGRATG